MRNSEPSISIQIKNLLTFGGRPYLTVWKGFEVRDRKDFR